MTTPDEVTPVVTPVAPVVDPVAVVPVVEDEPKVFSKEYVEGLRSEAAKHRTEKQAEKADNEALRAQLKEYEDAKLSEEDKRNRDFEELKASNATAVAKAREAEINFQVAKAAAVPDNEIGDVNAAIKLIDRDTLEFDDNGKITNLQDALATLKAEYPSVVKTGKAVTAPNTGVVNPGKAPAKPQYTREDLKKLPIETVNELFASGALKHLTG
jgi:hypothetical protein